MMSDELFLPALAVAAVLAGAIASVSGFGIGSILTPLLAWQQGTKPAVAEISIPHLLGTALRFWRLREHIDRCVLLSFGLASAAGGLLGALLANIYLHYVFDLWADSWRKRKARGDVIMVRYADDIILGFQYRQEAEGFLKEMGERFLKFNLKLHSEKTRLIEFGRFAVERRRKRGKGKPETFTFLGFTHICGRSRKGKFMVLRKTDAERMRGKVQEIKKILRERMHWSIPEVGRWLKSVLTGHYQYYGVPWNGRMLSRFRWIVIRLWCRTLRRRSQKHRITWKRMYKIAEHWLPIPFICHPYPLERLCVTT